MRSFRIILGIIISLVLVMFVLQNLPDRIFLPKKRNEFSEGCSGYISNWISCPHDRRELEKKFRKLPDIHFPEGMIKECIGIVTLGGHEGYSTFSFIDQGYMMSDPRGTDSVRVLLFCPGYQIITKKFNAENFLRLKEKMEKDFKEIKFIKLSAPSINFTGQLIDSWGNPIPGEEIALTYNLEKYIQDYCADCISVARKLLASVTDEDGHFVMKIHPFLDDPGIHAGNDQLSFSIVGAYRNTDPRWTLNPQSVPIRRNYEKGVTIEMATARLEGKISDSLWQELNIAGEIAPSGWRYLKLGFPKDNMVLIESRSGRRLDQPWKYCERLKKEIGVLSGKLGYSQYLNSNLKKDKTFSVVLPPDKYDLYLRIYKKGGGFDEILVGKDIILEKGEIKRIEVDQPFDPGVIIENEFDFKETYDVNKIVEIKKEYYPNGKLKTEIPFNECSRQGTMKEYDENGVLFRETTYRDGRLYP